MVKDPSPGVSFVTVDPAGSTVTKDTPGDGSLTIARAKQVSIHKWKNKQIKGSK